MNHAIEIKSHSQNPKEMRQRKKIQKLPKARGVEEAA
jgi:hypothetical protein